ncbi:MAG TPA: glycosyltransferase [Candidatus Bathyarchaeia archaeon]|nr:glycosyltransferase [Candidatus Bathyarchaeia archaeon]
MKIAIVGTRGIPNRYGGFEQFAEKVSSTLTDRGHEVTVYCRKPFTTPGDQYDRRVKRVILPTIHQKHLDTLSSGLVSAIHVAFSRNDVVLLCNVANSPFAWLPRVSGKPVVLNVDGLDRRRGKWNALGQAALHVCEWISTFTPTRLVTDARPIHDYYRERYGKDSTVIGYGADIPSGELAIDSFHLQSGRYVLYVSRLEPENNPELVLEAWRKVRSDWPLVMVGDNRYDRSYLDRLRSQADGRVVFTGAIYGNGYWALQKHASIFVFACEVGGVHPALIEAMASQNAVLYLESPENNETAGDAAIRCSKSAEDLAAKLQDLLDNPAEREQWARRAAARAHQLYRWDDVAAKYEALFLELLQKH